jgi:P27 family predicted phage terminase small subunit
MPRGRKPKPTHIRLVEGNAGKRPINGKEPQPRGNLYDPPHWFSETQRAGWAYAIDSAPPGLLKRVDRSALVTWVVAEDLHRQAAELLGTSKAVLIKTPNGMPVQSPYIGIINKQALVMLKAASEMGFTPASRSRVKVEDAPDEDDEFFGGR